LTGSAIQKKLHKYFTDKLKQENAELFKQIGTKDSIIEHEVKINSKAIKAYTVMQGGEEVFTGDK